MKIGILSDTHGCWDDKFALYLAECDEIWHAGDIGDYDTLECLRGIGPAVRAVSGNIDYGPTVRECPYELIFTAGGCPVMITHIGGYPGKYAAGIKQVLKENGIRIFISGHSHILKIMPDSELGLLHINPGAAGRHGWHKERTLVRLEIKDGQPTDAEIITLDSLRR